MSINIGGRIKNRRKELNMSVDELANKLGKNRATIYRYEKGDIENLPIDILEPLAKALNISPKELLGWRDDNEREQESENETLLGLNIKRLRLLRNIGMEEIAKELNISIEQLKKYESGRAEVPLEIIEDLAKYFGIEVDELMGIHHNSNWLPVTKKWIDKIGAAPLTDEEIDKVIDYAGYILYLRNKTDK